MNPCSPVHPNLWDSLEAPGAYPSGPSTSRAEGMVRELPGDESGDEAGLQAPFSHMSRRNLCFLPNLERPRLLLQMSNGYTKFEPSPSPNPAPSEFLKPP